MEILKTSRAPDILEEFFSPDHSRTATGILVNDLNYIRFHLRQLSKPPLDIRVTVERQHSVMAHKRGMSCHVYHHLKYSSITEWMEMQTTQKANKVSRWEILEADVDISGITRRTK